MKVKRRSKRELVKKFKDYGFHIWAIVVLANVLLAYSLSFYFQAAKNTYFFGTTTEEKKTAVFYIETTPTPTPLGPIMNIAFSVPGIGSGGGNLKPLHKTRDVTFFLYATGVNASNFNVKPLYVLKSKARFDDNVDSPTYTLYMNPYIDLGSAVKDGDYQVSFRTNQSFRTLIKDKPTDVQGKFLSIQRGFKTQSETIKKEKVILGDLTPLEGDNIAGLDDYRVFALCYGEGSKTSDCPSPNIADLNDDGVVDSLDYNILVINYKQLASMGIPVPTIYIAPTRSKVSRTSYLKSPTPKKNNDEAKPSPTPTIAPEKPSVASLAGGIIFFLLVIVAGVVGFVLFKANPKFRSLIKGVLSSKIGPASPSATPSAQAPTPQVPAVQPVAKDPNLQEYYIKNQGADETKTGFWLELTGDTGKILGHYKGAEIKESFAQVKGAMKTENGKTFLEISEVIYEPPAA